MDNRVLMRKDGEPDDRNNLEMSSRPVLWTNRGDHVHLKGLRFRQAANRAQQGAVELLGTDNLVEDCAFEDNNSVGLKFGGERGRARRCTFQRNGQLGFTAWLAHGTVVQDCVVRDNAWKGWRLAWEAGGNKILFSKDFVVERSVFEGNRGNGLWFDIDVRDAVVRHNLFNNNAACGLFFEVAYGVHVHDNVFVGNGHRAELEAWVVRSGAAISNAPDGVVERNLFVGNREGFTLRETRRETELIEDLVAGRDIWSGDHNVVIWGQNHRVMHNLFAGNTDNAVGGWFATGDRRWGWPENLTDAEAPANATAAAATGDAPLGADSAGKRVPPPNQVVPEGVTFDAEGQPVGLTLERLNLTFDHNLFAESPRPRPLYVWGAPWTRHAAWDTLAELQRDMHLEPNGNVLPVPFVNPRALDFRLPADHPAILNEAYPNGDVPGVRLGVVDP